MSEVDYSIIKTRVHDSIKNNSDTWDLVRDSYCSGSLYVDGAHLFRYSDRESVSRFQDRKKRSVPRNHVQGLSETLNGFLFEQKPERKYPDKLKDTLESFNGESFNKWFSEISLKSLLYPSIILIDNKVVDGEILTVQDEKEQNVRPYPVVYTYDQVRDFSLNKDRSFDWLLLDTSYIESSNPMTASHKVNEWTLWTQEDIKIFRENDEGVFLKQTKNNTLKHVPASFTGPWVFSKNNKTSVFETIAMLSRSIFNLKSAMDENLYSGSFKIFVYQTNNRDEILKTIPNGPGSAALLTYEKGTDKPGFIGSSIEDIDPFLKSILDDTREIFRTIGMTPAEESRKFVESGAAKSIDFRKTAALLNQWAIERETWEKQIIKNVCLYFSISDPEISITYNKSYDQKSLDEKLSSLFSAYALPYEKIQQYAAEEIIKKTFEGAPADKLVELLEDIREYHKEHDPETLKKGKGIDKDVLKNQ